jgi:hypothetical protein
MHERDQKAAEQTPKAGAAGRVANVPPAAIALQRAVGNRATARALQRMEVADAIEPLEKSMAAGVLGAEHRVADTLAAFSMNNSDYDKVAIEYQKKTEAPMMPARDALQGAGGQRAQGTTPAGFFPGISGEKYPETPSG